MQVGIIHPAIDPELVPVLDAVRASNAQLHPEPLTVATIPAYRERLYAFLATLPPFPRNPNVVSETRTVPGPQGESGVRVKIHRPVNQADVLPCYFNIHGGGMFMGSVDGEEPMMSAYVEQVKCVVVSVDYRLAPEHPHPAPVEDCYAALVWTAEHAEELRLDGSRVAVGGFSAGGGLAAATALLARDRRGPGIAFQYLVYPMLDDRNATPSSHEFTGDWPMWPREMNLVGWEALLGDAAGGDDVSPYAAPARAQDLSGLPPAYVDTGGLDVFRDEDLNYAQRLMQAGVPVEFHCWAGLVHGYDLIAPLANATRRSYAVRFAALRRALHPEPVQ